MSMRKTKTNLAPNNLYSFHYKSQACPIMLQHLSSLWYYCYTYTPQLSKVASISDDNKADSDEDLSLHPPKRIKLLDDHDTDSDGHVESNDQSEESANEMQAIKMNFVFIRPTISN